MRVPTVRSILLPGITIQIRPVGWAVERAVEVEDGLQNPGDHHKFWISTLVGVNPPVQDKWA
jgi:hypothetical protein